MQKIIGYARVKESKDKLLQDQIIKLKNWGCKDNLIFYDITSKISSPKPSLSKCLSILTEGDTLVVTSLDRIGMSISSLIKFIGNLISKGIKIKSLNDKLFDTTGHSGEALKEFINILINTQNAINKEKTSILSINYRARGRLGGRKPLNLENPVIKEAKKLYNENRLSTKEICKKLGISDTTFYKYLSLARKNPLFQKKE
jgi:DNA invertase Pin-like site-specific DNA recombinase